MGADTTTLVNNSQLFTEEFLRKIELCLSLMGELAEGYAKQKCPWDTGRLRNSITYATPTKNSFEYNYEDDHGKHYNYRVGDVVEKDTVYIGTNVEYGPAQEFGDFSHKPPGQKHFLRDSVAQHQKDYHNIAEKVLKSDN